ncbi:MAG TPA: diacylglycerol kinase family protein [Candidatus Methanoperedens sp.]|nr:diacylglycerol kinase family protein [Candidatus Methanoperedens sp.]HLB70805.1 diacylglycerol kinase family protein [Candidatus Methanoperedens sp.]
MRSKRYHISKLGVIANPEAGSGEDVIEDIAQKAMAIFRECSIIRPALDRGRNATVSIAGEIARQVDAILVIGGDGTMSDVAYGLYGTGADTPVIGIGAGSTNAGPLITEKAGRIEGIIPEDLTICEVGGIIAALNKKEIGLGFNDVVLGDTVLTTLGTKVIQVSAAEFMKGRKIHVSPSRAGTGDSEVFIIRQKTEIALIHKGEFGQMFAAPIEARYLGKGLAGGVSLAAALGLPAGIAITSEPLINFSIEVKELLAMEPVVTRYASFREGDEVVVRGLKEGTCLNIDGNPLALLGSDDEVSLGYIPSAVKMLKKNDS